VVGKAQGQGHYQNKSTTQGNSRGGAYILVTPLFEGLIEHKTIASP